MTDRIDTAAERKKLAALEGHTPGPWFTKRAVGISNDIGILVAGGCVAECFADIRESHEGAVQEQYVNAQLCAAAPDLKDTLAAALDEIDRLRRASEYDADVAKGMTAEVELGDGASATIIDPRSFADGGPEWVMRYGSPCSIRFVVASLLESYDGLLSDNITAREAVRRLRLMRSARAALSGEGET